MDQKHISVTLEEVDLGGMLTARGGHDPVTIERSIMPTQSRGHATRVRFSALAKRWAPHPKMRR